MFSKKATKVDEIFTIDLTLCSKCQIEGEDHYEKKLTKNIRPTEYTLVFSKCSQIY